MARLDKSYMVQAVREHAKRYEDAGWDVVTNSLTDEQISAAISRIRTVTGAVNLVAENVVRPWVNQRVDARPGEDDDEELKVLDRFTEERVANSKDATLWWPEDRRSDLLAKMAEPEAAAGMIPLPRVQAVEEDRTQAPTPQDEKPAQRPAQRRTGGGSAGTRSRKQTVKA
jgi:hypothetical protein